MSNPCRHDRWQDCDLEPCSKCGNLTCPHCRVRRKGNVWCVLCWNEASERESAREEKALSTWRCARP